MYGIIAFCLAYVLSQFFRSFLAVLTPVLTQELGMSLTELSYASGAWFLAFALFQFPVGILLDTIGPRRTGGYIFLIAGGGGILLFSLAQSPTAVIIAMALNGIGCSPALMAPFYIFAREYSAVKLATYSSTFIAIGTLGNVAGSEPLAAAIEIFGWRSVGYYLTVATVVIGFAALILTVDPKKVETKEAKGGYFDLLKLRKLWPIFPIMLVAYAAVAGIRGLWVAPYLEVNYGLDTLEIGRATLYMAIALVMGTLIFGPLDRIFNTRKWVVFGGNLVVLLACIYLSFGAPQSVLIPTVLFMLIGFFGASYAVQMTHGRSFLPSHLTGRGVTLLNFCSIGGAGIFQAISGWVVDANTIAANPGNAYEALFIFYSIIMGVAIICYLFSQDVKPS